MLKFNLTQRTYFRRADIVVPPAVVVVLEIFLTSVLKTALNQFIVAVWFSRLPVGELHGLPRSVFPFEFVINAAECRIDTLAAGGIARVKCFRHFAFS